MDNKQDVNGTLRAGGIDAVRDRHDRAHRFDGKEEQQDRATPLILPPPSQPMQCAREFVAQNCLRDGVAILRYWRDGWWAWRTSHWFEIDRRAVRSMLYTFTEHAFYLDPDVGPKPWAPTRRKIGDMLEALGAICILSDEFDQPRAGWISGPPTLSSQPPMGYSTWTNGSCIHIRRSISTRRSSRLSMMRSRPPQLSG
jgi:hypothetical protein